MIEINYSKFFIPKKEIWLFDGENSKESFYTTYPYYLTYPGGKIITEQSCFINLTNSIELIKKGFSKTTKLHINKAHQLNCSINISYNPSIESTLQFCNLFKKFAQKKNISFSKNKILALQKTSNLILSYAYLNDKLYSLHAFIHDSNTTILLHTFNLEKNNSLNAITNKYLHYQEIISFKENNFKTYDFGGVDLIKVPGITRFKLSFGSQIIKRNSSIKTNFIFKILNLFRK